MYIIKTEYGNKKLIELSEVKNTLRTIRGGQKKFGKE